MRQFQVTQAEFFSTWTVSNIVEKGCRHRTTNIHHYKTAGRQIDMTHQENNYCPNVLLKLERCYLLRTTQQLQVIFFVTLGKAREQFRSKLTFYINWK